MYFFKYIIYTHYLFIYSMLILEKKTKILLVLQFDMFDYI